MLSLVALLSPVSVGTAMGQQAPPPAPPAPAPAAPAAPAVDSATLPDFGEVTLDGIVFVKIPAGQFTMGTTDAQREALKAADGWTEGQEDERPARRVTITRPFLMGKFEVTQKQWKATLAKDPPGSNPRERRQLQDPAAFKGDDLPVESVSWADVQLYLERLNRGGGGRYRLPTEAEWEYCARAGGDGVYGLAAPGTPITAETIAEFAWFRANSSSRTQPAGGRKPNAWGLHDMLGSVWEWCQDWYDPKFYAGPPSPDPVNQGPGTERVFRGGCWTLEPHHVRCALRGGHLPGFRSQYVGFRLVRELPGAFSPPVQ